MKRIKILLRKKSLFNFIKFLLVPFILVVFWFSSALFLNDQASFSVLRYQHDIKSYKNFSSLKLVKGNKVTGEFRAKENYLGIVFLRFNDFLMDYQNEGAFSFKIREKQQKDWYYSNVYRIGLLKDSSLFPFGFSPISDSMNKTYLFEIDSSTGNRNNSIQLSRNEPVVISAYQFPKEEITSSKRKLISFIYKKSLSSLISLEFIRSSLIYALPLFFYVSLILLQGKRKIRKLIIPSISLGAIYLDTVFLKTLYPGILFGLITLWALSVKRFKIDSRITLSISFLLIFLWIILTFIGIDSHSEKLNVWTYTFLLIGVIQMVLENRHK